MLVGVMFAKSDWKDWLDYCEEHQVDPFEEIDRVMKEAMHR